MLKPVPVFLPSKAVASARNPAKGWSARVLASGLSKVLLGRISLHDCVTSR